MIRFRSVVHDAWCAISRRCGWNGAAITPMILWLKEQEEEARKSTERIRQQHGRLGTGNPVADRVRPPRRGGPVL